MQPVSAPSPVWIVTVRSLRNVKLENANIWLAASFIFQPVSCFALLPVYLILTYSPLTFEVVSMPGAS